MTCPSIMRARCTSARALCARAPASTGTIDEIVRRRPYVGCTARNASQKIRRAAGHGNGDALSRLVLPRCLCQM